MALIDRHDLARPGSWLSPRRMAAWLAARRPSRQPQAGAAPDAAVGTGGDLPAPEFCPEYEQAGSGAHDLSVTLLRGLAIERVNQARALRHYLHPDGQGLSRPGGDHGLGKPGGAGVASIEHTRRRFLRRGARGSALALWPAGRDPDRRGSQFDESDRLHRLPEASTASRSAWTGKGRCMDNIFVERLWRSLEDEEVYLQAHASVAEAKTGIGAWLDFYKTQSASTRASVIATPQQIYQARPVDMWTIGSAVPAALPRFPSELGKRGNARLRPHTHRHHNQQNNF